MKKLLIKIIIFTIILFTFTGCYSLSKMYLYRGVPTTNTSNIMDYIYMYTLPSNQNDRNTSISHIFLEVNTRKQKYKKVEILTNKVKILYQEKEYYVNVSDDKTYILIYKNGLNITGDFIIYLGKIRFDGWKVIEAPPIKVQKYVKVTKYNPIADGLNINTAQDIYYGPAEEYKGR